MWRNRGAPVVCILGGILAAGSALARGARGCSSGSAALEVSAISAQGLENKWVKRRNSSVSPGSQLSARCIFTSVPPKWQVCTEVWGAGAWREPSRGLILPGGLGPPTEVAGGWDTAGAIVGCPVHGGG